MAAIGRGQWRTVNGELKNRYTQPVLRTAMPKETTS